MHIAFLTAEYPPQPGGVGDYTRRLGNELAAAGHRCTVITSERVVRQAQRIGYDRIAVLRTIAYWDWECWQDVIATLDTQRPDVLHIQYQTGAYGMHPAINFLPWRLRGLPSRPHIAVTYHDTLEPYLFPKAGWLRYVVTLALARYADNVITTNGDDAHELRLAARAHIIPIGSNIAVRPPADYNRDAWRKTLGVQPDDMLVAYFGLLSRSKGIDVLVQALSRLNSLYEGPRHYMLLLIGGAATAPQDRAYAEDIAARLEHSPMQDRVIRTGHVDETAVSAHLLASDCVVLPFRTGATFRNGSMLAALSHGVPVVTTRPNKPERSYHTASSTLSSPRLIDGDNVLLVPPEQCNALADAIQRLSEDSALHTRLSTGARALAAHFTWDEIARRHEELYMRG